jgi:hypothetical protein
MANATGGNPIILDTAVANWAALSLPNKLCLMVYKVEWLTPTSAGDTFTIQNADGLVLLTGKAEAASGSAGNSQVFNFVPAQKFTQTQGWYLSQITSGKLYIWFD